eukprot:GHVL01010431.1.p1 GENE.GHVL01010431.1~~GHVL01010431.1.p1  ORF type:complete len:356 (+),score=63.07 GHVL01010431.1:125-1192(+)
MDLCIINSAHVSDEDGLKYFQYFLKFGILDQNDDCPIEYSEGIALKLGGEGRKQLLKLLREFHEIDGDRMDSTLSEHGLRYGEMRNATLPELFKMSYVCGLWNEAVAIHMEHAKKKLHESKTWSSTSTTPSVSGCLSPASPLCSPSHLVLPENKNHESLALYLQKAYQEECREAAINVQSYESDVSGKARKRQGWEVGAISKGIRRKSTKTVSPPLDTQSFKEQPSKPLSPEEVQRTLEVLQIFKDYPRVAQAFKSPRYVFSGPCETDTTDTSNRQKKNIISDNTDMIKSNPRMNASHRSLNFDPSPEMRKKNTSHQSLHYDPDLTFLPPTLWSSSFFQDLAVQSTLLCGMQSTI